MNKRLFILLVLLLTLVVSVTSVAAQESLTVLCTPQEDWCVAMTQAFQEQTGIETSYVRMSSGESLARIRATEDNPEFSVWWGGPADAFIAAKDEGLLEQYVSPSAEAIPADLKDPDSYWTGVYVGALGFCSNVEILDELGIDPPASWADLLNPALEANVAMAHPATSGTAFTALWTVVTLEADKLEYPDGMPAEGEEMAGTGEGFDADGAPTQQAIDNAFAYFAQLNNNILQYTRSGSAPGTLAGNGEIAVAIIFSHDCVKLQVEGFEGVVVTSFPEDGTGYEIGGMAIIKGAPELEAAQAWYDWALTPEAQAVSLTVNSLQLPTNPDSPVSPLSVNLSEVNLVNYNFVAAGANRTAMAERFDQEVAPAPTE
ncbi:MAG: ABC transporter substrate-binding protein [Anaerolineae bacterium]|nr:ABC transporter substrate-binding protein [Anaerolineae bacterium]